MDRRGGHVGWLLAVWAVGLGLHGAAGGGSSLEARVAGLEKKLEEGEEKIGFLSARLKFAERLSSFQDKKMGEYEEEVRSLKERLDGEIAQGAEIQALRAEMRRMDGDLRDGLEKLSERVEAGIRLGLETPAIPAPFRVFRDTVTREMKAAKGNFLQQKARMIRDYEALTERIERFEKMSGSRIGKLEAAVEHQRDDITLINSTCVDSQLAVPATTTSPASCIIPKGYKLNVTLHLLYRVYSASALWKSWNEARSECASSGTHLVNITNPDLAKFIMKVADLPEYYVYVGAISKGINWEHYGFTWKNEGSQNYLQQNSRYLFYPSCSNSDNNLYCTGRKRSFVCGKFSSSC